MIGFAITAAYHGICSTLPEEAPLAAPPTALCRASSGRAISAHLLFPPSAQRGQSQPGDNGEGLEKAAASTSAAQLCRCSFRGHCVVVLKGRQLYLLISWIRGLGHARDLEIRFGGRGRVAH
jgi:hypothetical protein